MAHHHPGYRDDDSLSLIHIYTLAAWSYRSLHQVAEHEGRETVERSRHAMAVSYTHLSIILEEDPSSMLSSVKNFWKMFWVQQPASIH